MMDLNIREADPSTAALAVNPDGAPPNFNDPPTLRPTTLGIISVIIAISAVIVVTRLVSNLKQFNKLMVDDYFCVLAWILAFAYGVLVMTMSNTAQHAWDVPISAHDASWFKRNAALATIIAPTLLCAKASIFTLYLRYFSIVRWMRWSCWLGLTFSIIFYVTMTPLNALHTFPSKNESWGPSLSRETTGSFHLWNCVIIGVYNVISDVALIVLPLPILLGLQLSLRKRIGLCAVFATTAIGLGCSILGLYYRVLLLRHGNVDGTWYAAVTYLTVVVDIFITIMIGCVPSCVSSWKVVLRDSYLVTTLRSLLHSSTGSLSRISSADADWKEARSSESSHDLKSDWQKDRI